MIKLVVLSSGSKGNTTYLEIDNIKMLIDVGNTCKYITENLAKIEVDPQSINAILLTHTHKDHINGLKTFIKKYNTKVYITEPMYNDISYVEKYILLEEENSISELKFKIINTSHDALGSVGYIFYYQNHKIAYITDTGYINKKYDDILNNCDIYIIESNHDIELLQQSSYPFVLRQRILSDKGHLSNMDASKYLCKYIGNNTKYILLAHLSEENNKEELAINTLKEKLKSNNIDFNNIIVAKQNCPCKEIIIKEQNETCCNK